ncbi:MAG: toxin-antitoxin system TumE family protein [Candidatus Scalindua sp.]
MGWDIAPHHKEVSSFPNHKHISNKIKSSQESNQLGEKGTLAHGCCQYQSSKM